ncbi:L-ribulose-5-phosphate 4-epimerase [Clostridium cellulovorans]|uniref:L-ribulose-5-phosphate 4-epimerase n=1 Tax=Clostridium cellulovorans (strain ATCC 35296 / DSM 3052 / OCM 3 / 743B) TaxID=573061 RepID=D9SUV5_CLOC7|nr:L-ribulose-5-phosphate 4-epimerase [Clostridium cellulovorans]ADL51010.1 class II aldolase/adducin family protein [Clostridium cellulovorans 743B]
MLEALKKRVFEQNLELVNRDLVLYTWGNVSGIDRETNLVVIKPSGVDYDTMSAEDMVVVDLEGNVVEGKYKPSSDTATHLEIYKAFEEVGGIVHTHSTWATTMAQIGVDIPALGTTHADYFYKEVPCTRPMTKEEIEGEYEKNTGTVIIETFKKRNITAIEAQSVLVNEHGPFSWGESPEKAVFNAVVLEQVAKMAYNTMLMKNLLNKPCGMDQTLLDKHFLRKHGPNAYYGQK